jgi:HAD superfamily hydrolase (TIGR01509 family)
MPNTSAIIFDFDGTLVDTMPLHYEAYRRVLADEGIVLAYDDYFDNVGGTARESIPKFLRGRSCRLSAAEIHARKKQIIAELFASQRVPMLETAKLLPLLFGRWPLALASSGSRPGVEQVLEKLDWRRYFAAVVTGEDAERGKPAPDLFLLAAQRLDAPPEECLVFEDTDAGVAGARAAGMMVFDVRRTVAATSRLVTAGSER